MAAARVKGSEERKIMMMELREHFGVADTDNDKVLKKKEYENFRMIRCEAKKAKYGGSEFPDQQMKDLEYQLYNSITPQRDGVSFDDLVESAGIFIAVFNSNRKS